MRKVDFQLAQSTDSSQIKDLMLLALESDPTAFSVSASEYSTKSKGWWSDYLGPFVYQNNQKMLLAYVDEELVGFVGIVFDTRERKKHVATIVWFYVKEDYRGFGIGKRLMEEIFRVAQDSKIKKLSLMVCENQQAAIQIYTKYGFSQAGVLKDEIKIGSEFYDVFILEYFF